MSIADQIENLLERCPERLPDSVEALQQLVEWLGKARQTFPEELADVIGLNREKMGWQSRLWHSTVPNNLSEQALQRASCLKSDMDSLERAAKTTLTNIRGARKQPLSNVSSVRDPGRSTGPQAPRRSANPGGRQAPLTRVAQAARGRPEPVVEWKTLLRNLDICTQVIVNIQADLRSLVRSSRMVEGLDSQKTGYKEILQWIADQLNRTKDGIETATAEMASAEEEDQVGHLKTHEKISKLDREFMALLPRISAARNVPRCSQRTMGAFVLPQTE
jgi:hypothetical protein